MDKLTLEILSGYLPHGLKLTRNGFIGEIKGVLLPSEDVPYLRFQISCSQWWEDFEGSNPYKPILRSLSSFTDINSKAMNDLNLDLEDQIDLCQLDNGKLSVNALLHGIALECFRNHIDIYGLINKGLAVDINTL